MPTALITGASSGIGAAFARHLARDGHDLVLVARTPTALERTARELRTAAGRRIETLPADLATADGCAVVEDRLRAGPAVDVLVNNAGTALGQPFPTAPAADESALLDLNARAVLRLTHAALPHMLQARDGAVVNVASIAGCGPSWLASTYPASKAWVIAFSESVGRAANVRRAGVRVMAVLPGYTRTELHARNAIDTTHFPAWMWLPADRVAAAALRDLRRGRRVSTPGRRYQAVAWAMRHLPRTLIVPLCWDLSRTTDRARPDTAGPAHRPPSSPAQEENP
ncbi:SDR family NAD(P)-dependent oxidoreductase [Streptomyces noursei]|uniref:SDR family NAD(P)-dependent oxidoreductase n=1 Tax=Streptomyces noursei TaxID=1971 RepID=UPI0016776E71|nr:SDR family oxidoreductase [Streptomyces noursei]MCZ1021160.1 SDR family oxidoreductase [Streptomyces noursei]GGX54036.1 dehydrogenase [Streptomyces noursei]